MNYDLIGQDPSVEQYRDSLPKLIARYKAEKSKIDKMMLGATIELCAGHFYGIDAVEYTSMAALIDAIEAVEQDLKAK